MTQVELLQGSDAVAQAALAAGCRFFSGYPMLPFTGLLESFSRRLPAVGGVCMNAASEIEAANMALGASTAGARAATGSTGQGVALMQETVAEAALSQISLVIFTMARGQQDYFQCTRGGGWGDYRTLTLAPKDAAEAVEHTQLLFHLADRYRAPMILLADYLIGDTMMSVDVAPRDYGPLPAKDWVLDPARNGTRETHVLWTFDTGKVNNPGLRPDKHWRRVAEKFDEIARVEPRHESYLADDAEYVIVSWGTSGPFVDYVVDELRADGIRAGSFRPITLWPFPEDALEAATANCRKVLVFEINAGQMIDDVRLSVADRSKVSFIGGVSVDYSGMRQGTLLDVAAIRERVMAHIG
jgi:2-oxoglutarate/2-oxoacid ferredoxin oxidoreductase subunit alpha